MAWFDLPLTQLRAYTGESVAPADLWEHWEALLKETDAHPLDLTLEPIDNRLRLVDAFDVTFTGHGGQRVRGWLHVPAAAAPRGLIVRFHGYSGGRGLPLPDMFVAAELDSRGQGWDGSQLFPSTPDSSGANSAPGLLTRGVHDPREHYYARLYVDAVRLTQAAARMPGAAQGIAVAGASQGRALAIATAGLAGLAGVALRAALVDVPFLCDIRRAVRLVDTVPYGEVARWLRARPHEVERVYEVLSYVDNVHLAARAGCPVLFSVGLEDTICPPSTVFAAFNSWRGVPKEIEVYQHNGHEGGQDAHVWRQLEWLSAIFASHIA